MRNIVISFIVLFVSILSFGSATAQNSKAWNRKLNSLKYYIENKGQFTQESQKGELVLYGYVGESEKYFFTNEGIIIRIDRFEKKRNPAVFFKELTGRSSEEEEMENSKLVTEYVFVKWNGADKTAGIVPSGVSEGYYTFGRDTYIAGGYSKITYQNLYPGIDFEFVLPQDSNGIKYNVIVHGGADISKINIEYSGDVKSMTLDSEGNVVIETPAWNLTEHAPVASQAGSKIPCNFILKGNTISFSLPWVLETHEPVVIDPWVTGLVLSSDDLAYDVDYDNSNNLYAFIRPYGTASVYINKYSPSGALLWSHLSPYDFTAYEGNFAVEKDNSRVYIGEGFNGSGALLYRLFANGVADGFVSVQNGNYREIWDVGFDNSSNSIIVVGGGTSSNVNGGIVNTVTGVLNVANFTGIGGTCQDIVSYTIDNQSNLFVVYAKTSDDVSAAVDDKISKVNAALNGNVWMVGHGMNGFSEVSNHFPNFTVFGSTSNGFNALAVNDNYLYYYDGGGLAAFNKSNGDSISATSVGLSGSLYLPLYQGGIAVDDCNNIYVGGNNNNVLIYYFNGSSFTLTDSIQLGWAQGNQPFDIRLNSNSNLLFVSGRHYVGVYSAMASNQITMVSNCLGAGESTASISISTSLSNPVITYTWYDQGGTVVSQTVGSTQLSDTVTGLPDGVYTVHAQFDPPYNFLLIDSVIADCPDCNASVVTTDVSCAGGNDGSAEALQSGGVGPFIYLWSPAPGTGQGTNVAGNMSADDYSVLVIDYIGCTYTAYFTINEPPQDSAYFTFTSNQGIVTFTNLSTNGAYYWDFGDGMTSLLPNPVHNYIADGNYNVCLTVYSSCDTVTTCLQVPVTLVGNCTLLEDGVKVFPNPAGDFITIDFGKNRQTESFIKLTDKTGRVVFSGVSNSLKVNIDVSGLAQGMYFLSVNGTEVKIVIER